MLDSATRRASHLGDDVRELPAVKGDLTPVRDLSSSSEASPFNRHLSGHSLSSSSGSTSSNLDMSWDAERASSLENISLFRTLSNGPPGNGSEHGKRTHGSPIYIPSRASVGPSSRVYSPPAQQEGVKTKHPKRLLARCRASTVPRSAVGSSKRSLCSRLSSPATVDHILEDSHDDAVGTRGYEDGNGTISPILSSLCSGYVTGPSSCASVAADYSHVADVNRGVSVSCLCCGRLDEVPRDIGDQSKIGASLNGARTRVSPLADNWNVCPSCVTQRMCGEREADVGRRDEFDVNVFAKHMVKECVGSARQKVLERQMNRCECGVSSCTADGDCRHRGSNIRTCIRCSHMHGSCGDTVRDVSDVLLDCRPSPCVRCMSSEEDTHYGSIGNELDDQPSYMKFPTEVTAQFAHGDPVHNVCRSPLSCEACAWSSRRISHSDDALQRTPQCRNPEPNRRNFKTFAAAAKELIKQKTRNAVKVLVRGLHRPNSSRKSYGLSASADPLEGHRHGSKTSIGFASLRRHTSSSIRLNYLRRLFQSEGHKQAIDDDDGEAMSHPKTLGDLAVVGHSRDKTKKCRSTGDIRSSSARNTGLIRCRSPERDWSDSHSVTEFVSLRNDIVKQSFLDGRTMYGTTDDVCSVDVSEKCTSDELRFHVTQSCSDLVRGSEVEEVLSSSLVQETVL